MTGQTKRCSTCKEELDIELFGMSKRQPDGHHYSCKSCCRAQGRKRYLVHRVAIIAETNAIRDAKRLMLLSHYSGGGVPHCACCGERHVEFLSLDHIDGGGSRHRAEVGSGNKFYLWLIREGLPSGFRVLCMNCNFSLGRRGYCPHDSERAVAESERPGGVTC